MLGSGVRVNGRLLGSLQAAAGKRDCIATKIGNGASVDVQSTLKGMQLRHAD